MPIKTMQVRSILDQKSRDASIGAGNKYFVEFADGYHEITFAEFQDIQEYGKINNRMPIVKVKSSISITEIVL